MNRPIVDKAHRIEKAKGTMISILPFETLERASHILNQLSQASGRARNYTSHDFLAWAINGDINLTVVLPNTFHVFQKNGKNYVDAGLTLPKGSAFFFAARSSLYSLCVTEPANLDSLFCTLDNTGTKNTYWSAKPYMEFSLKDLRISAVQFSQLIVSIYPQKKNFSTSADGVTTPADVPSKTDALTDGVTKEQVLQAFGSFLSINLGKALADGKGLFGDEGARIVKGTRGGKNLALWDPVHLAIGLRENYLVSMTHLSRAFEQHDFLRKWADRWRDAVDRLNG